MNKLLSALFLLSLTACAVDSVDFPYKNGGGSGSGIPSNPTQTFKNESVTENRKLTSMYSRNDILVEKYIGFRLNNWKNFNGTEGQDVKRTDIANAALWLLTGDRSQEQIEQYFADDFTLFHLAGYAIDNRMNRCFDSGTVADAAKCFVQWREDNGRYVDSITKDFLTNAVILSADSADLASISGEKIAFTVNKATGLITGIKVADQNFNNKEGDNEFYYISEQDGKFIENVLTYESVGKELGLSYSDFGSYDIIQKLQDSDEVINTVEDNTLFAGGYAEKQIAPENIAEDLTFKGKAIGNVSKGENSIQLSGKAIDSKNNNAVLTFDKASGTSSLEASFANWYDINVSGDSIKFSNYKDNSDKTNMRFDDDKGDPVNKTGADMDVKYYGQNPENGIPSEAVGFVQFDEGNGGIKMDVAFGARDESENVNPRP